MSKYIDAKALYEALYEADAITFRGMEIFRNFPAANVVELNQPTTMKNIPDILREKRIEMNLPQKYIAYKLGLDVPRISKYETGKAKMFADIFLKWALLLDLDLSDFKEVTHES